MATMKTATCTALITRTGKTDDGKDWAMTIGHFVCTPALTTGYQEVFSAIIPANHLDRVSVGMMYDVILSFEIPKKPQKTCKIIHIAPSV